MYNTRNYTEPGGDRTVIGGTLEIAPGGSITTNGAQAAAIADETDAAGANPTKAEYDALVAKFNAVLAVLRSAGLIASS